MRREDWPERLVQTVTASQQRPFGYGEFDCGSFAGDAIVAVLGQDVGAALRGSYSTAREALRRMRDWHDILNARFERVAPALLQRGDIASLVIGRRRPLGVCYGAALLVAAQPRGTGRRPICDAAFGWRIE